MSGPCGVATPFPTNFHEPSIMNALFSCSENIGLVRMRGSAVKDGVSEMPRSG